MSSTWQNEARTLGRIYLWPGGYAMSLADSWGPGVIRCCSGHPMPQEARDHGLVRLGELAGSYADRDVALWDAAVTR